MPSSPRPVLLAAPVAASAQGETIAEIRVHGNHTTPDADVLSLSGLQAGAPATDERLRAAEQALRESGRFETAQVLKRFRSLDDPTDILVMIVVQERPATTPDDLTPSPFRRLRATQQWLPILDYADGYGLTYGARTGFRNAAGSRSRLSRAALWGGERRAAAELERSFDSGPLSLARAAVAVSRRVNPHYEQSDVRTGLRLEAERACCRGCTPARTAGSNRWTSAAPVACDMRPWRRISRWTRASIRRSRATPSSCARDGSGPVSRRATPRALFDAQGFWGWSGRRWRCARSPRVPDAPLPPPNNRCSAAVPPCAATAPAIAPATAWPRCRPSCACRSTRP